MNLEPITCPSCGANRFDHDAEGNLICSHCGANFGAPAEHINCPACGVQNPPQARKCMNCGLTLGKLCPACNHTNPPGADHCLNCATPLDTLSSVMMRTGSGVRQATSLTREDLVRTKGQDMVFMEEQRAKLDAEEQERQGYLAKQRTAAVRQQRTIAAVAIFGGGLLICCVITYILAMQ